MKWGIGPDMKNVTRELVALLPHSGEGGVCPEPLGGDRPPELAAVRQAAHSPPGEGGLV